MRAVDSRALPVLLTRNAVHGCGRGFSARTQELDANFQFGSPSDRTSSAGVLILSAPSGSVLTPHFAGDVDLSRCTGTNMIVRYQCGRETEKKRR